MMIKRAESKTCDRGRRAQEEIKEKTEWKLQEWRTREN